MSRSEQNQKRKTHNREKMSVKKKIGLSVLTFVLVLVVIIGAASAKVYFDVAKSIEQTYETPKREETAETVNFSQKQPFSLLLLGIDTGDLGRTEQGRSDSIMVATVSPKYNKTTLISIPRDTYMPIVGYGKDDKVNHAYAFGGAGMSMDTIQSYLGIPINHYAAIDMEGIRDLVDAVGGIDVNNELEFSLEGMDFPYGKIHLNGIQALGYIRMRYDDPRGDYGRQERQRQVIEAIGQKLLSLNGVTQYQEILNMVEKNLKTDLSFDDMQKIAFDYRDAFKVIDNEQLQGEGFMQDGISYQRVPETELARVQDIMKKQLR